MQSCGVFSVPRCITLDFPQFSQHRLWRNLWRMWKTAVDKLCRRLSIHIMLTNCRKPISFPSGQMFPVRKTSKVIVTLIAGDFAVRILPIVSAQLTMVTGGRDFFLLIHQFHLPLALTQLYVFFRRYAIPHIQNIVCMGDGVVISYEPLFMTMKKKGITSYRLFKLGFPQSNYYAIKRGENISTHTVNELCRILDCNVEDIMT